MVFVTRMLVMRGQYAGMQAHLLVMRRPYAGEEAHLEKARVVRGPHGKPTTLLSFGKYGI